MSKAFKQDFSYEQEFLDMATATRIAWATGLCVLAIGRGDIGGAIHTIIDRAWRTAHHEAKGDIKRRQD